MSDMTLNARYDRPVISTLLKVNKICKWYIESSAYIMRDIMRDIISNVKHTNIETSCNIKRDIMRDIMRNIMRDIMSNVKQVHFN
jgi:hypothetical protein